MAVKRVGWMKKKCQCFEKPQLKQRNVKKGRKKTLQVDPSNLNNNHQNQGGTKTLPFQKKNQKLFLVVTMRMMTRH